VPPIKPVAPVPPIEPLEVEMPLPFQYNEDPLAYRILDVTDGIPLGILIPLATVRLPEVTIFIFGNQPELVQLNTLPDCIPPVYTGIP
jgi:hypothetical protein